MQGSIGSILLHGLRPAAHPTPLTLETPTYRADRLAVDGKIGHRERDLLESGSVGDFAGEDLPGLVKRIRRRGRQGKIERSG